MSNVQENYAYLEDCPPNRGYIGGLLGFYWDNGKENGNCYLGFRVKVPLKHIEYGVYGDPIFNIPEAIFYLLKGDYRV